MSDSMQPTTTPAEIRLGVGTPNTVITTRGAGTVGDMQGAAANVWHGETLHIYAVNEGATNLSEQFVSDTYNIPTFLIGGNLNATLLGEEATAPSDVNSGLIEFASGQTNNPASKYYPLNGAYNFMGYHVDDAALEPAEYVANNTTIRIPLTYNGTQDIMLAQAELTNEHKVAFIQAMINNGKLQYTLDDCWDATEGKIKESLSPEAQDSIETEFTKAFSSYSARRGIQPTLAFYHQLSRLTFLIKAGSTKAVARSCEPPLTPASYKEIAYPRGQIFTYNKVGYFVKSSFPMALTAAQLFDNPTVMENYLQRLDYLDGFSYKSGDIVRVRETADAKEKFYKFTADYTAAPGDTWEQAKALATDWTNDYITTYLEYKTDQAYSAGDFVFYDDAYYVFHEDVTSVENLNWSDVELKVDPFQQGVFISKVVVKKVHNTGHIDLTSSSIGFTPNVEETDSYADFELMQADKKSLDPTAIDYDPIAKLVPLTPTGTTSYATPALVGESMMVTPGEEYYLADITLNEYIDSKGNVVDDAHREKVYANVKIGPGVDGTTHEVLKFEKGKSYQVTVTVNELQIVEITATLVGWEDGGTIEVEPDEDSFETGTGGHDEVNDYVYYGSSSNVPETSESFRTNRKRLSDSGTTTVAIDFAAHPVQWIAVPEGFTIDSWILNGVNLPLYPIKVLKDAADQPLVITYDTKNYTVHYYDNTNNVANSCTIEIQKTSAP